MEMINCITRSLNFQLCPKKIRNLLPNMIAITSKTHFSPWCNLPSFVVDLMSPGFHFNVCNTFFLRGLELWERNGSLDGNDES